MKKWIIVALALLLLLPIALGAKEPPVVGCMISPSDVQFLKHALTQH